MTDRLLLRVSRVAELLDLSRSKTYELIADGTIPSVKIGNCVRVPAAALPALIQARMASERSRDTPTIVGPRHRVQRPKAAAR